MALEFLKFNKLSLHEEYQKVLIESMNNEMKLIEDETRIINNVSTNVDEVFNTIELDINWLKKYPGLNTQYKEENGKVVPKTREELIQEYENYKNGQINLEGNPQNIEYLYQKLISFEQLQDKKTI